MILYLGSKEEKEECLDPPNYATDSLSIPTVFIQLYCLHTARLLSVRLSELQSASFSQLTHVQKCI